MDRDSRPLRLTPAWSAWSVPSVCLLALGVAVLAPPVSDAEAGCLAPADRKVDSSLTLGPVTGNVRSDLLYTRDPLGVAPALVLGFGSGGTDIVGTVGIASDLRIDEKRLTWTDFHAGSLNAEGDIAIVASTALPDDTATPGNEAVPRRTVVIKRSNTFTLVARRASDSPIRDTFGQPVPWGSFFDVELFDRGGAFAPDAVFVGDLGVPDRRSGLFGWSGADEVVTPIHLTGDTVFSIGAPFASFGRMRANGAGDIGFSAATRASPEADLVGGLFVRRVGVGTQKIIQVNAPPTAAPGGGTFSRVLDFDVGPDGTVVFAAELVDGVAPSGLFRASPPAYVPTPVVLQGAATDLGLPLGEFRFAHVRAGAAGNTGLAVPIGDNQGFGLFTIAAGSTTLAALSNPAELTGFAALGDGRLGYQTREDTRRVSPADGSEEGATNFSLAKLDFRNIGNPLNLDTIRFQGSFRLPPQGTDPGDVAPIVFRTTGTTRFADGAALTGGDLTQVTRVLVSLSTGPGNNFDFSVDGNAGTGAYIFNTLPQSPPNVSVDKSGGVATIKFKSPVGRGKLTVDLVAQTFKFALSRANIRESFEAPNFRVHFELRSAADALASRTGPDALFHYDERIDATQAPQAGGRRVRSKGANPPGGVVFVDRLQVKRKLKSVKGQAAPQVTADDIKLSGRLVVCPGASLPTTPTLDATLELGDLQLIGVQLARKGNSSNYRFKSVKGASPSVDLRVDVAKGTFALKAKGVTPLTQLVNADFSGSSATNDPSFDVGGMELPFRIRVERLYESEFPIPVVRRKKGKVFER